MAVSVGEDLFVDRWGVSSRSWNVNGSLGVRVRHDRIDKTGTVSLRRAGRMHHISLGRALKGTPVILIIDDLNIRVVDKTTGELIRKLVLNPNTGYQPRFKTKQDPTP